MNLRTLTIALPALLALVLAGCDGNGSKPMADAGVVGYEKPLSIGVRLPDMPFVTADGEQTMFRKVSQPISIVSFIFASGQTCCQISPELAVMAEKFQDELITVAQISIPTSQCPYGPGCVEVCSLFDRHLILLCDKDKIAWRIYKQPNPNTVFLVDQDNTVVAIESITSLEKIESKALALSNALTEAANEASEY